MRVDILSAAACSSHHVRRGRPRPDVEHLRAAPTAHTLLRTRAGSATARSLEVVAGPDVGVVVLRDFRAPSARQIVAQPLGPDELLGVCDAFLHASDDPGDGAMVAGP